MFTHRSPFIICISLFLCCFTKAEPPEQRDARLAWWKEARFGMFIHWSPSSVGGKEIGWGRNGNRPFEAGGNRRGADVANVDPVYDNYYRQFNPTLFNADEWVQLAQEAGMKYMVFTSKHHEGFSMWPTQARDGFDISDTPWKNGKGDVLKELSHAAQAKGMKIGWYYSQRDWTHPDYGQGDNAKYKAFMTKQITEILSNYGKIDVMWWDSFGKGDSFKFWHANEFLDLTRKLQPQIVINNRCAFYAETNRKGLEADFDTPEQQVGKYQIHRPWESCITLVGHQWSFQPGGRLMSFDKVIHTLVSCATGDGNLLLNVGPMADGRIEPRQADLLRQVGSWMNQYGDGIRGTRGGPFPNGPWGGATFKDKSLYLYVFPNTTGTIVLPKLSQSLVKSTDLTQSGFTLTEKDERISITLPKNHTTQPVSILKLTFDEPLAHVDAKVDLLQAIDPALHGLKDISHLATYSASSLHPAWSTEKDTLLKGTCQGDFAFHTNDEVDPFIQIDLGKTTRVEALSIENRRDAFQERAAGLTLWASIDGKSWQECWKADKVENNWTAIPQVLVSGALVKGVEARYLKLGLNQQKTGTLHLRSVKIYSN